MLQVFQPVFAKYRVHLMNFFVVYLHIYADEELPKSPENSLICFYTSLNKCQQKPRRYSYCRITGGFRQGERRSRTILSILSTNLKW